MEGGDLQVATWIKDEGFDTTIPSVMQVLFMESSRAAAMLQKFLACSCHMHCPHEVLCCGRSTMSAAPQLPYVSRGAQQS